MVHKAEIALEEVQHSACPLLGESQKQQQRGRSWARHWTKCESRILCLCYTTHACLTIKI